MIRESEKKWLVEEDPINGVRKALDQQKKAVQYPESRAPPPFLTSVHMIRTCSWNTAVFR